MYDVPPNVTVKDKMPVVKLKEYEKIGLNLIMHGKVGVVVLAGGQGSRLGFEKPKGMFDINLPSHKSLFQILTERFLKAQLMAHGSFALSLKDDPNRPLLAPEHVQCKMLIMTSPENHEDTVRFFHEKEYFGGFRENFVFFQQQMMPAVNFEGKILMSSPS